MREQRELARIDALRIPPAWQAVHIAVNEGRRSRRGASTPRGGSSTAITSARSGAAGLRSPQGPRARRDLPLIRASPHRDFRRDDVCRQHVLAGIVRLISEGFFRPRERAVREGEPKVRHPDAPEDARPHRRAAAPLRVPRQARDATGRPRSMRSGRRSSFLSSSLRADGCSGTARGRVARPRARDVNPYLRERWESVHCKDFRPGAGHCGPPTSSRSWRRRTPSERQAERGDGRADGRRRAREHARRLSEVYVHPIVIARYLDAGDTIARGLARAAPKQAVARTTPRSAHCCGSSTATFPAPAEAAPKRLEPAVQRSRHRPAGGYVRHDRHRVGALVTRRRRGPDHRSAELPARLVSATCAHSTTCATPWPARCAAPQRSGSQARWGSSRRCAKVARETSDTPRAHAERIRPTRPTAVNLP